MSIFANVPPPATQTPLANVGSPLPFGLANVGGVDSGTFIGFISTEAGSPILTENSDNLVTEQAIP